MCLAQSDFYSNCFQIFKNLKMDEEINCAIFQKSLDNVNDVVNLRENGSEGINRASRERNDLIQTIPGNTKHAAANTATQIKLIVLRKRRGKVQ